MRLISKCRRLKVRHSYLPEDQIEHMLYDGEDYGGTRPCHYEWVKALCDERVAYDVTFVF